MKTGPLRLLLAALFAVCIRARAIEAQAAVPSVTATDSVTIRLINIELRTAVQTMAQYLDRPVVFSGAAGAQVTMETPQPVPRASVIRLLRGLLESENYELVDDSASGLYRARPKEAVRQQAPAMVATRQSGMPELFVLPVKHARAEEIAITINSLYGHTATAVENRTAPTLGEDLRQTQSMPADVSGRNSGPSTRAAALTGDVTIVPDQRGNNLLIRANRNDFDLIKAAVEQLDVQVLQVLIEALVVEVRRDRGISVSADGSIGETDVNHNGATASGIGGNPGLADFAIKVMHIGAIDFDATIRLAAQHGDVRIVSRPVVLTENNKLASIVVGSQQPFVQIGRSLPTDAAVRDEVVQYKEVGTKLSVLPTISADSAVQLEVTQEVSSATGETQFNAPVISQRSVQTQLMVRDGQTIVLGGLADRTRTKVHSGIPFLSAIPVIGGLFGRWQNTTNETELFVFLTPHVIRDPTDADRMSQPMRDRSRKAEP